MASNGFQSFSRSLNTLRALVSNSKDPLTQYLAPRLTRSMATETSLPASLSSVDNSNIFQSSAVPSLFSNSPVLATIYKFPSMEPLRFESYKSKHLYLPLRKDILHRAVIFEGDATRQGTANTKTRFEVHGSHRKIRPQKGLGRARLGTRQSPMLRGGGKSFGPHPRDFATRLPRKMYDLAWRTALSYRYRKGELIICEDGMDIEYPEERYMRSVFEHNHWGKENNKSLVITGSFRENLFEAIQAGKDGKVLEMRQVDVKDLLEMGRVIIEKRALDEMLTEHQSDLVSRARNVV